MLADRVRIGRKKGKVYLAQDDDFVKVSNRWVYRGSELEIEVPHIIQGEEVTAYSYMFYGSGSYLATPVTRVVSNNKNVTDMKNMFFASSATTLDLSSFDTSNVTNMSSMFRGSYATSLDLSSFDISNVTNMTDMFWNSRAIVGYAKTQEYAYKFNTSSNKPSSLAFFVKPPLPWVNFTLNFVPEYSDTKDSLTTNIEMIPYDCILIMDVASENRVTYLWNVNGESFSTRAVYLMQGDELSITATVVAQAYNGTMVIRGYSVDGSIVSEFDFILEPNCYLTTAMVGYFNKADDGIELTAMRELRSHSGYKYQDMLEEYSQASPIIIKGIEQSENKDYYYNMIKDVVDNIVIWEANEEWEEAETSYLDLYYYLKERFEVVIKWHN